MSDTIGNALEAINNYSESLKELHFTGVFRSNRYTGDLGEWYVKQLYDGDLAPSPTQKDWDITLKNDEKLQVKTQTYDENNRWNYFTKDASLFDRFILVILTENVIIRDLYDVPSDIFKSSLHIGKERKPIYKWDDFKNWRVDDPSILPGYEKVKNFIK